MGKFAADISKFVKKTGVSGQQVQAKVTLDALKSVVMLSPVKTGRFRGNWNVGVNRTNTGTTESVDKTGGSTIGRGEEQIKTAKWGDLISISNNLSYARDLERGKSKQSPKGMVGLTFIKMVSNLEKNVRAASAG